MSKFLIFFALVVLLIFGGMYFLLQFNAPKDEANTVLDTTPKLLNRVQYMCNSAKTIDVGFYETAATTSATVGQPPTPNGSVKLAFSDGRAMELPQVLSASGARYATADESFVFWSKGNGVLVLENNEEKNYIGCVLVAPVTIGVDLPAIYASTDGMFSLRLPSLANANADGYSVNESFENKLSPTFSIDGVKFTIPKARANGTNLSNDTFVSVENILDTKSCTADLFFGEKHVVTQRIDGAMTYSVATSSDAAAGNRYEEIVYALPGTNPCMAVRYMIHYGAFENYATGTVTQFNSEALITEFDQIRRTLVVNQ